MFGTKQIDQKLIFLGVGTRLSAWRKEKRNDWWFRSTWAELNPPNDRGRFIFLRCTLLAHSRYLSLDSDNWSLLTFIRQNWFVPFFFTVVVDGGGRRKQKRFRLGKGPVSEISWAQRRHWSRMASSLENLETQLEMFIENVRQIHIIVSDFQPQSQNVLNQKL